MRGSLEKNELVDAARQVRTELVKTRQAAMETGVAQQFRYRPNSGAFEVVPNSGSGRSGTALASVSDAQTVSALRPQTPLDATNSTARPAKVVKRCLPNNVRFKNQVVAEKGRFEEAATASRASIGRSAIADASSMSGANLPALGDDDWSAPIVFYPNGRTSNARIHLESKDHHCVEIALRGVTGTVTLGEVHHDAESSTPADGSNSAAGSTGRQPTMASGAAAGRSEVR